MVRFLCIHGVGTNGKIFEAQTAGFRAMLPAHWEWEFVDGEMECKPAPGVDSVYPGPYLCFSRIPSIVAMEELHDWILDIIKEEGPFDAVMGFSEGGSLAASVMLHHQITRPFEPPLFRSAIFICTFLPRCADSTNGVDVTPLIIRRKRVPTELVELRSQIEAARAEADYNPKTDSLEGIPLALSDVITELDNVDNESFDYKRYVTRMFHPEVDKVRIQIPTAHVVGRNDPVRDASLKLVDMCDVRYVSVYEHKGGHELPKTADSLQRIKDVIQKTVMRSELP